VVATENLGKEARGCDQRAALGPRCIRRCSSAARKETIEQTQIGAIQMLRVSVGSMGPIVDDINVRQHAVPVQEHGAF